MKFRAGKYLLICAIGVLSLGCDNDDDNKTSNSSKIAEVENRAINGEQWRVSKYSEDNVDQTSNYSGYIFEFDQNNLLTATNGSDNFVGTWSITDDDGSDDDSNDEFDDIDFNIGFTNPSMFEELTEDWEIVSITESRMELRHTSGGDGETDLLTFEKI